MVSWRMQRNQGPYRAEYTDTDGHRKWTIPTWDGHEFAVIVAQLSHKGATDIRTFRENKAPGTPCLSYSKYPGSPFPWNGRIR